MDMELIKHRTNQSSWIKATRLQLDSNATGENSVKLKSHSFCNCNLKLNYQLSLRLRRVLHRNFCLILLVPAIARSQNLSGR